MMRKILNLLAGGVLAGVVTTAAHAEFHVRSPTVVYREVEIEHNGSVTLDKKDSGLNHKQSYTTELAYGVTPWWKIGVEAETGADADQRFRYQATTLENMFQLTPQGEYWADLGLFAEYSQSARRGDPNTIEFGPVAQKETAGLFDANALHTVNLFLEKEVGHNHGDDLAFSYAAQSRLLLTSLFQPGVEIYGEIGKIDKPGRFTEQEHRFGPMFAGAYSLAPYGKIKYELGYLFGVTPATENGAVRWLLEYEIAF
jgi:hypothetical protein